MRKNGAALAALVLLGACSLGAPGAGYGEGGGLSPGETGAPARAIAVLHPTEGSRVRGTVSFTRVPRGVRVVAQVTGLAPGLHGFHVHERGDCSASDGKSAGGHFNPHGQPHGGPASKNRHVGDLGNLAADEQGRASMDAVDPEVRLEGPASVIGRAVIVHGGADDLASQPSGAAGPRVACGVIGIASP